MKNLFINGTLFIAGAFFGMYVISDLVEKGEVVYEDDEKFVRAEKSKSLNHSYAKVYYKKPQH